MRRPVFLTVAVLTLFGAISGEAASTTAEDRQFDAIVQRVVSSYDNENLSGMSNSERLEWNACVVRIFSSVPQGRKRYVLETSNRSEQARRLEQISMEDRAAVRQQITRDCPV